MMEKEKVDKRWLKKAQNAAVQKKQGANLRIASATFQNTCGRSGASDYPCVRRHVIEFLGLLPWILVRIDDQLPPAT